MQNSLLNLVFSISTLLFVIGCSTQRSNCPTTCLAEANLAKGEVLRQYGWRNAEISNARMLEDGTCRILISRVPNRVGSFASVTVSNMQVVRIVSGL
jgi:hypothetical protein